MSMTYDRCRCCGMTFAQINAYAQKHRTTSMKRLRRELKMGAYCTACLPYLREMFRTGKTEFDEELTM